MLSDISYVAAVVLIPLLPAFVLYKFLPSKTTASGPFQGLDVKLSGAFAGYFLVLLMVTSFVIFLIKRRPTEIPQPKYQYDVYTVLGRVELSDSAQARPDYSGIKLSLAPPQMANTPDGSFSFQVPVRPDQIGQPDFPNLLIAHQDSRYETKTIPLSENFPNSLQGYTVERNKDSKTIRITNPIKLVAAGQPYNEKVAMAPSPEK
jgi:hypothetical protein